MRAYDICTFRSPKTDHLCFTIDGNGKAEHTHHITCYIVCASDAVEAIARVLNDDYATKQSGGNLPWS